MEVINARRTESLDAPEIEKLITVDTNAVFGRVNVISLIERSQLAITLTNEDDAIIAHAAFYDYPNIETLDPADWEHWLHVTYLNCERATALNSLFLHFFVARGDYASLTMKEIIKTVYNASPDIHYVFLMALGGSVPQAALMDVFEEINLRQASESTGHTGFISRRHNFFPVLHVRRARVEDNDDLTPIFSAQNKVLRKTYGDFFLAELIEAENEQMHCLAVEANGRAVGFLSVSKEVNLDLLNACFELGAFHGLRKPHTDDKLEPTRRDVQSRTPLASSDSEVQFQPALVQEGSGMLSEPGTSFFNNDDASAPAPPNTVAAGSRFVPTYAGGPNAVVIQLFAIDERYEMRSLDFMQKLFALFPDRDYAVITVPRLVPEFPLLQNFVRITPRPTSTLSQELYVFHKGGLISNFNVRVACTSDTAAVDNLVRNLKLNANILTDLKQFNSARRDPDGTEIQSFVAECLGQVVGVAIIRREESIEYIRSHYNIEDFIYFDHHRRREHGRISHLALNPIFYRLTKTFIKEVLRLGRKTCLYYPVYPEYVSEELRTKHSLITALGHLVPVRPRRQVDYPVEKLGINAPVDRVLQRQQPYALYHINRKLIMEPKVTINEQIVVVGASTTGLAFLERLVFCPHLRFNNLILISPHGITGDLQPDQLLDQLLGINVYYSRDEFAQIAFRTCVNIVYGKMTAIDRKKKQMTVDGSFVVAYDHMIISTGLQYRVPCPTGADVKQLPTSREVPHPPYRRFSEMIYKEKSDVRSPRNLFVVNDDWEADQAIHYTQDHLAHTTGNIIIYGRALEAYCCIQMLLSCNIQGKRIVLVKPPMENEVTAFNNPTVEDAVEASIRYTGAQIHCDYFLAQWNDTDTIPEQIQSVSFTSYAKPIRFECEAFFAYYKKVVDYEAFRAMNDACLVFDSRLVIDANFHTNDVCIRGAGPLTKYQRIYYADTWTHAKFNSKNVGDELAKTLLVLFDPTLEPVRSPPVEEVRLIPTYTRPILRAAFAPGNFHYLHIAKPGLDLPLAAMMAQSNYGRVLQTGSPEDERGYFRLHINQYHQIETVTCLSKKRYSISNLICLYGLHERTMNNLCSRFDEGIISDFFDYFNEIWAIAIYHDRFQDFREEIRELLMTRPVPDAPALEEQVRKMMEEDLGLTDAQRAHLRKNYQESGAKRAVETRLLSFISYNYYHLPMYAKPDLV